MDSTKIKLLSNLELLEELVKSVNIEEALEDLEKIFYKPIKLKCLELPEKPYKKVKLNKPYYRQCERY